MDRKYMDLALIEARKAMAEGDVPVGAVVVLNGEVIGVGRNRREKDKNAVAHAEILAIEEACKKVGDWRLDNAELYVTLEPCPMCMGAAINARIGRIVFAARDARAGACGSLLDLTAYPLEAHPLCESGLFEEEAQALLRDFFARLREQK